MSSQSPYRTLESPSGQNQPQVDTSPSSDQHPPFPSSAGLPQQPGYVMQQPYPLLPHQPVMSASLYHFCPQCGTRLTPNAMSCSTCGKSIPEPAPTQSASPQVVRPGKPVIPARIKTWYVLACIAVLFQGILSTAVGVFILSYAQNSAAQFIGSFTLVFGVVFSVLGVFVVRKSRGMLIAAVVIFSITLLLALVTNPVAAIIQALLFLTPMIGGITVMNEMKKLETAGHAVSSGDIG
jgi:hypothetical protein